MGMYSRGEGAHSRGQSEDLLFSNKQNINLQIYFIKRDKFELVRVEGIIFEKEGACI